MSLEKAVPCSSDGLISSDAPVEVHVQQVGKPSQKAEEGRALITLSPGEGCPACWHTGILGEVGWKRRGKPCKGTSESILQEDSKDSQLLPMPGISN